MEFAAVTLTRRKSESSGASAGTGRCTGRRPRPPRHYRSSKKNGEKLVERNSALAAGNGGAGASDEARQGKATGRKRERASSTSRSATRKRHCSSEEERFSKQYWERLEGEGALSCEEDASDEPTSSLQSCSSGDSLQEKYERSLLGRCLSGRTRLKSSTNAIGEKRDMMHGKDSHASCTLARTDTVELCEEDASNAAGRSASTSTDRGSDSPTPAARKVPCAARAASSCRSSSSSSSSSGSGAVPASARSSSASSSSFVVHSVASSSVERRVRQERSDIVQQYEEYKQAIADLIDAGMEPMTLLEFAEGVDPLIHGALA